jgi:hypothetical protein
MGYGGTILIPRSPHGDLCLYNAIKYLLLFTLYSQFSITSHCTDTVKFPTCRRRFTINYCIVIKDIGGFLSAERIEEIGCIQKFPDWSENCKW